MICKHWREYDDDIGLYEYCKLTRQSCYCCGTLKQCNFQWARFPLKTKIKKLFLKLWR